MEKPNLTGTAQIPSEYWKAARLIGSVPFIASQYDQRASYCMYIPESHYQLPNSSTQTSEQSHKLPLIVNIHGSLRRAEHIRDSLIPLADSIGAAVLAPLFPAGIDDPNDSHNYKFLRYNDIRYDLILLSMVDEVAARWLGIETGKFYMAGFSGGGQFVSRFFLLHPERLQGVSIGAPGMVTRLNRSLKWPEGLDDVEEQFGGLSVDIDALKTVNHVQLVVGENDTKTPGDGLLEWAAEQRKKHKEFTGEDPAWASSLPVRTEALAGLRDELVTVGVNVRFDIVPSAGHDSQKIFPTVVEFLRNVICK